MPKFLIQGSLHKWPGSFDDQAVTVEVSETVYAKDKSAAWIKLDKLIIAKKDEFEKQGFRVRFVGSEVKKA